MHGFRKILAILVGAAMLPGILPSSVIAAGEGTAVLNKDQAAVVLAGDSVVPVSDGGNISGEVPDGGDLSAKNIQQEMLEDGAQESGILPESSTEERTDGEKMQSEEVIDEAVGVSETGTVSAGEQDILEGTKIDAPEGGGAEEEMDVLAGDVAIEEIVTDEDLLLESEAEAEELLAGPLSDTISSRMFAGPSSEISDNRNAQDYSVDRWDRWSSPVNSYLTADGTDYLRIENFDDGVLVERYDSNLLFQSRILIPRELEIFGGFYAGSDAYYLVFGQTNPDENDSAEVVRVVKYGKDWTRLGQASLCGANTTVPFDAGSLRMAEYGGYLYIRTCHEMYTSPDGKNHQANLMIQVRTSDMTITDYYAEVMNSSVGYVSHSFNQFILVDDAGNLVALDHGDAYPRGILLGMYGQKAGNSTFLSEYYIFEDEYRNVDLMTFRGETGDNYTGASVGGLEYSSTCYLTVGNSVPQDENWSDHAVRNIFVTATPRDNFTASGSRLTWITNYAQDGNITSTTPQLVKFSSDSFLLMWNEVNMDSRETQGLCYLFLDGNGNPVGSVQRADGCLSDCKPILSGESALWYVTDGEKLMFCRVNSDGSFEAEPWHLHNYEPDMAFEDEVLECGLVQKTTVNGLKTNSDGVVTYTSSDTNIAEVNSDGTVVLKGLGTCTITAHASAGIDYGAKSLSYTLTVLDLLEQTIQVRDSITCIYGDEPFSLNASCLDNAEMVYSTDNAQVADISADGVVTVNGVGTTGIFVRARRTEKYAGAVVKIPLTVEKKNIGDCRMAFSKIGNLSINDCDEYVIIINGEKVLQKDEDYQFWGSYRTYVGSDLLELTYDVAGNGNYTGEADLSASPIRQKPELTSLTESSQGAVLEWEEETGAVGYKIYRKQGDGEEQLIKTIPDSGVTSWTDTESVLISEKLTYYIKAYTINGSEIIYTDASDKRAINQRIEDCSIELSENRFTYDGKAKTPKVTVNCDGEKLKQGQDYKVSYENNTNAGTAKVIITGKGDYSGSVEKTFTISKASQSLKVTVTAKTILKGKKAQIRVSGSFGKVTYTSKNKKVASVSKKGVVKGKAAGKTVITVKAAGDQNHKAVSKKITVKVKKK